MCDFQGIQSEQATLISYWSVDVPIVFDRFVSLSLNRWTTDLHSSYDDNRNTAFDNFLGSFQLGAMTLSLLQGQGSAQEGGYEDTGVQIERGVPPAVREIQHLSATTQSQ